MAFFVTCLLLEVYLQLASIQTLSIAEYTPEGLMLKKNESFVFFKEGFSINRTNNHGILGDDVQLKNTEGVIRIALMGDSFTEGFQVFDRDHFRSILQGRLGELCGNRVEILNFGRSGFDLNDCYGYYTSFVRRFEPDYTLILLRESDLKQPKKKTVTPLCYIDKENIRLDKSYQETTYYKKKLRTQYRRGISAIGDILQKCNKIVKEGKGLHIVFDKLYYQNEKPDGYGRNNLKLSPVPKMIFKELQKDGAVIVLHGDFHPDNLDYITKNSEYVIDLQEPLQQLAKQGVNPYYWEASGKEGHWNHRAHNALGLYLADHLYTEVLPSGTNQRAVDGRCPNLF